MTTPPTRTSLLAPHKLRPNLGGSFCEVSQCVVQAAALRDCGHRTVRLPGDSESRSV